MVSIDFTPLTGSNSFTAGDKLFGILTVNFDNPMSIKGVKVKLHGKGTYEFKIYRTTYTAKQTYFYADLNFLQADQNDQDIVVEPKTYAFPVYFELPENIPASFKGKYGWVGYSLVVTIQRGALKPNIRKKFPIYINGVSDLNHIGSTVLIESVNSNDRFPLYYDVENQLETANDIVDNDNIVNSLSLATVVKVEKSVGCFSGTKVGIIFMINKTGFVPGENIQFDAKIISSCDSRIRTSFRIIREVNYIYKREPLNNDDGVHKYEYETVFKFMGPTIGPRASETWSVDDASIKMPDLLPSLGGESIFGINYCAQLTIKSSSCCGLRLIASIPITIGTVPLNIGPDNDNAPHVLEIESQTFENYPTVLDKMCKIFSIFYSWCIVMGIITAIVKCTT